jgi:hypothetical protein
MHWGTALPRARQIQSSGSLFSTQLRRIFAGNETGLTVHLTFNINSCDDVIIIDTTVGLEKRITPL